jgi:hypothetical protein
MVLLVDLLDLRFETTLPPFAKALRCPDQREGSFEAVSNPER